MKKLSTEEYKEQLLKIKAHALETNRLVTELLSQTDGVSTLSSLKRNDAAAKALVRRERFYERKTAAK